MIRMLRLKEVIKGEVVKEQDLVKKGVEIQKMFVFFGAIHRNNKVNLTVEFCYFGTCFIKCRPHLFPQLFLNIQNHTILFTY